MNHDAAKDDATKDDATKDDATKDDATKDDATKDDEPTLGVRCAWCGKILRGPVGFANPADPLAWTHGICRDCAKRFEDDALLPLRSMLGNPSGADGAEFIRGGRFANRASNTMAATNAPAIPSHSIFSSYPEVYRRERL